MSGSKDRLSREEKRERGSRIHFLDFHFLDFFALTVRLIEAIEIEFVCVVAAEKGPFYL